MVMHSCVLIQLFAGLFNNLILSSINAGDTRFATNVIMLDRVLEMLSDLKEAAADDIWTAQLSPEPRRAAAAGRVAMAQVSGAQSGAPNLQQWSLQTWSSGRS